MTYSRVAYLKNKANALENQRRWRDKNPERFKQTQRNARYIKVYGITLDQYNELLEKQQHCCAICGRHESEFSQSLHVDHAHGESPYVPKNAIRGLLCSTCNRRVIGNLKDPVIFENAAKYLRQHTGLIVPTKKRKRKASK